MSKVNEINNTSQLHVNVIGGGVYLKNKPQNITITWEIKDDSGNRVIPDVLFVNNIKQDPTLTSKTFNRVFSDVDFTVRAVKGDIVAIGTTTARFVGPTQTVENSLDSYSHSTALSANQGRILDNKIENATNRFKGLFLNVEDLSKKFKNGVDGDWAIVGESIPAPIFIWNKNQWEASGGNYDGETVDLTAYSKKQQIAEYTDDYNISKNHQHSVKVYDDINWSTVKYDKHAPVFRLGDSYDSGEIVNMVNDEAFSYKALNSTNTAPYLTQKMNSFTLEEAISFLPEDLRVSGQKISFYSSEKEAWMTYVFTGGDYTNPTYWEIFTNNIDPDTDKHVAELYDITDELDQHLSTVEDNLNSHITESNNKFDEIDQTLEDHSDRMDDIEDEILMSSVEAACSPKDIEILADRAYKDHTGKIIADEYVTRNNLTNEIIDITNQQVTDLKPGSVDPEDLSEATKQLLGNKNITNLPDEEDITVDENNLLKFKDKEYSPKDYSGMGRKVLRKHYVNGVNTLTQHMINKPNTIYIIQYDYCLAYQTIEIPENCVLQFEGGSFRNGKLSGKVKITGNKKGIFKDGLIFYSPFCDGIRIINNYECVIEKSESVFSLVENRILKVGEVAPLSGIVPILATDESYNTYLKDNQFFSYNTRSMYICDNEGYLAYKYDSYKTYKIYNVSVIKELHSDFIIENIEESMFDLSSSNDTISTLVTYSQFNNKDINLRNSYNIDKPIAISRSCNINFNGVRHFVSKNCGKYGGINICPVDTQQYSGYMFLKGLQLYGEGTNESIGIKINGFSNSYLENVFLLHFDTAIYIEAKIAIIYSKFKKIRSYNTNYGIISDSKFEDNNILYSYCNGNLFESLVLPTKKPSLKFSYGRGNMFIGGDSEPLSSTDYAFVFNKEVATIHGCFWLENEKCLTAKNYSNITVVGDIYSFSSFLCDKTSQINYGTAYQNRFRYIQTESDGLDFNLDLLENLIVFKNLDKYAGSNICYDVVNNRIIEKGETLQIKNNIRNGLTYGQFRFPVTMENLIGKSMIIEFTHNGDYVESSNRFDHITLYKSDEIVDPENHSDVSKLCEIKFAKEEGEDYPKMYFPFIPTLRCIPSVKGTYKLCIVFTRRPYKGQYVFGAKLGIGIEAAVSSINQYNDTRPLNMGIRFSNAVGSVKSISIFNYDFIQEEVSNVMFHKACRLIDNLCKDIRISSINNISKTESFCAGKFFPFSYAGNMCYYSDLGPEYANKLYNINGSKYDKVVVGYNIQAFNNLNREDIKDNPVVILNDDFDITEKISSGSFNIPKKCIADFSRGYKIKNGTLGLNGCRFIPQGLSLNDYFENVTLSGSFAEGQVVYDPDIKKMKLWNGSEWTNLDGTTL